VVKYRNPNTSYAKTQGKEKQTHQCTCTDLKRHLLTTHQRVVGETLVLLDLSLSRVAVREAAMESAEDLIDIQAPRASAHL
jgi:hypothetical protein